MITEGPPKLNRTEPPVATLRSGEAPPVRALPAALLRGLEDLPTPFGAFSARWNRAGSEVGRGAALTAGVDASARLLCAAWLGVIASSDQARWRTEAGNTLVSRSWYRRELSPASWLQMSFRLASIIAARPEGVLGNVARALADAGGLAEDLSQALADDPSANASLLLDLFGSLLSLCRPLRDLRLVGFAARSVVAGEGEALWKLRDLRGPSPSPELSAEWHSGPIAPGSCHLVHADSSRTPLAPLLFSQHCPDCSALEVHAADTLSFGSSDRAVRCLRCGRSSRSRGAQGHLRALESSVRVWSAEA